MDVRFSPGVENEQLSPCSILLASHFRFAFEFTESDVLENNARLLIFALERFTELLQ